MLCLFADHAKKVALAWKFAPHSPSFDGIDCAVRDKAEVDRLLGGYLDVLAESKALSTWVNYAPHWDSFRYWVALTIGTFYTFKQLTESKALST